MATAAERIVHHFELARFVVIRRARISDSSPVAGMAVSHCWSRSEMMVSKFLESDKCRLKQVHDRHTLVRFW
jgi:hypothetical protein